MYFKARFFAFLLSFACFLTVKVTALGTALVPRKPPTLLFDTLSLGAPVQDCRDIYADDILIYYNARSSIIIQNIDNGMACSMTIDDRAFQNPRLRRGSQVQQQPPNEGFTLQSKPAVQREASIYVGTQLNHLATPEKNTILFVSCKHQRKEYHWCKKVLFQHETSFKDFPIERTDFQSRT